MIQFTTFDNMERPQRHYINPNAVTYMHLYQDNDSYTLTLVVSGQLVTFNDLSQVKAQDIRQIILENQSWQAKLPDVQ